MAKQMDSNEIFEKVQSYFEKLVEVNQNEIGVVFSLHFHNQDSFSVGLNHVSQQDVVAFIDHILDIVKINKQDFALSLLDYLNKEKAEA